MSGFLGIAGLILMFVGGIMLLVEAFGAGMAWGFGCLLLPLPVALAFVATHWYDSKRAFLIIASGATMIYASARSAPPRDDAPSRLSAYRVAVCHRA
jgi:hypothetical protein